MLICVCIYIYIFTYTAVQSEKGVAYLSARLEIFIFLKKTGKCIRCVLKALFTLYCVK